MRQADQWQEIARRGRNHAVLFVDYIAEGFRRKVVGHAMEWKFSPRAYRQFDSARWFYAKDVEGYREAIRRSEGKQPGYLYRKAKEYEKLVRAIRRGIVRIARQDFQRLSSVGLAHIFKRYVEFWIKSNGYLYNYLFINDYLAKELSDILLKKQPDTKQQMADLFALLSPAKKSEVRLEKEGIVTLAKKVREGRMKISSPMWNTGVTKHLARFAHLNRYIYYGRSYTAQDIDRRVKEFLSGKNLDKAQKEIQSGQYSPAHIQMLIKQYRFDRSTALKIQAARFWAYVPNLWDETFIFAVHRLRPMLEEIARRVGVTYGELVEMRYGEIIRHLKTGKRATREFCKELQRRYKNSALVFEHGNITLFTGKTLLKYETHKRKTVVQVDRRVKELRGQPASPGSARGKVSVVHSVNEVGKVKRGEILVASATTPMHVPAMEKAAAIVTDEGGLLSHAAIVSRELGVPCVVGTRIATKILKDGEMVEVDAEAGIVRKL